MSAFVVVWVKDIKDPNSPKRYWHESGSSWEKLRKPATRYSWSWAWKVCDMLRSQFKDDGTLQVESAPPADMDFE